MATIYSTQFTAGVVTPATPMVVPAPAAGTVYVLRELAYRCQSAVLSQLALELTGVATPFFVDTSTDRSQPPWTGRLVVKAGQTITIAATTSNYEVVLSGYLLD